MAGFRSILIALVLVCATAGVAAPVTAGDHETSSERFVLGGPHADAGWPPDPVQLAEVDQAAAAATCGVGGAGPGAWPPGGPPALAASASVGGACLPVPDGADERIRVYADQFVPDVYVPIALAAGYDVDQDGCIGCSEGDELWRGDTTLTIPVRTDQPWVMVFVYALDVDVSGYPVLATATVGEIQVTPGDDDPACGGEVSLPGEGCRKVPDDELEPHLCLPACQPVVDHPT